MDIAEHIKFVAREGELLADAAEQAGPDAPVPTCPGWCVRDLLRHTGMVHRWAAAFVREGHTEYHPDGGEPDLDGAALLRWFREGHGLLVTALTEAPGDLECWTFMPASSPLAFWARRQAHETAVHRVDAESALGAEEFTVDTAFAVDGIDELLVAFHARGKSRVRTPEPATLRIRATDTGDVWTLDLSEQAPRTTRSDEGPADCEVSADADRLYAALWNRLPAGAVTVTGDGRLARLWREKSGITWA
ncbi:maleylpyruvate isomerase family mycothiol-dependent enzyme [Streptomyces sp. SP18CS02]|uniref:maleylpyruvate isomerase family mycothiol-dependent enzyme n=1 Tax=Streptomyces sp. SP18CS02 TaxID=3002531 RepID=UPI002E7642B4|nr:maleylpyruvate isomerase family mycothiol-dependent enzyme [Streptomyces sp. SP18CS02]MEE1755329.1 maleylpyruvate isomerase family mycothiol-dependent enzyme [Streptomyces sp. SP18CS02]